MCQRVIMNSWEDRAFKKFKVTKTPFWIFLSESSSLPNHILVSISTNGPQIPVIRVIQEVLLHKSDKMNLETLHLLSEC